jgi:hypothetical protein
MIRAEHDRRFVVIDEKTRERIIAAYRDHGLSMALLVQRFGVSNLVLKRVLTDAGVTLRRRVRWQDFHRDAS